MMPDIICVLMTLRILGPSIAGVEPSIRGLKIHQTLMFAGPDPFLEMNLVAANSSKPILLNMGMLRKPSNKKTTHKRGQATPSGII